MNETLKLRQANLESLNAVHKTLVRESQQINVQVPEDIERKMAELNSDWLKVRDLSGQVKGHADISMDMDVTRPLTEEAKDVTDGPADMEGRSR